MGHGRFFKHFHNRADELNEPRLPNHSYQLKLNDLGRGIDADREPVAHARVHEERGVPVAVKAADVPEEQAAQSQFRPTGRREHELAAVSVAGERQRDFMEPKEIGRASCRERV